MISDTLSQQRRANNYVDSALRTEALQRVPRTRLRGWRPQFGLEIATSSDQTRTRKGHAKITNLITTVQDAGRRALAVEQAGMTSEERCFGHFKQFPP